LPPSRPVLTLNLTPLHARTSAEALAEQVPGKLLATGKGGAWKDLLVQIFSRQRIEESIIVPAVAEPLIVWVISGNAIVEERELKGTWTASKVERGDFFLTTCATPYELRWRATGPDPFEVMHVYVGLATFDRASKDVLGPSGATPRLRRYPGKRIPRWRISRNCCAAKLHRTKFAAHCSCKDSRKAWPFIWCALTPTSARRCLIRAAACLPSNCARLPT